MAPASVLHIDMTRPTDLLMVYETTYTEVHSLALFLCEEEGMALAQAMRTAAADLGYRLEYAEVWDRTASLAEKDRRQ